MKILIVDDSKAMQVIVKRGLIKLGNDDLKMNFAFNGVEALELARSWEPDIVLSDWHMPEMDGLSLLHALNREMLGIKVGFVTTETSPAKIQQAKDAGAIFIINKPFDASTLNLAVSDAIVDIENQTGEDILGIEPAMPDENPGARIVRPKTPTLQKTLRLLTNKDLKVAPTKMQDLGALWLPSTVGIFIDHVDKSVLGVCILDLNTTCILGGALANATPKQVNHFTKTRTIPKVAVDVMDRVFESISVSMFDTKRQRELEFKNKTLIKTDIKKVEALINRRNTHRIDCEIEIEGYGSGRIIIVTS